MKTIRWCGLLVLAVSLWAGPARPARPSSAGSGTAAGQAAGNFVLVAHGGAGNYGRISAKLLEQRRETLIRALRVGHGILAAGGRSLDAVEATLRVLEDSGQFDAGRGSYYTREGIPEMDAALMDGKTLAAGSVAAVKHVANPIHLARLVMEKTPHVLLVGEGAEEFAKSQGIPLVSPFYFYSDRLWKRYRDAVSAAGEEGASKEPGGERHGTVGAVALDRAGNLAAGTSTGGTDLKMPGRVGDSPILGAGTYADNESCAVSGTGTGEFFMRNVVAADICHRVRYLHQSLEEAARDVVMKELVRQHGDGGVIALDRGGHVVTEFNTNGMLTGTDRGDGKITLKGWSRDAAPLVVPAEK